MEKMRKIKTIECNECEKMITGYISNKLAIYDVDIMLNHIESCSSCKEELTIQFLVTEGLQHVEKSNNYNLIKVLEDKLSFSHKRVERHISSISLAISILTLILLASIGSTAFLLLY